MRTLGINAAFHDCAASLVIDGQVVAAVEEERFTEVKHGKRPVPFTVWQLPYHAIDYCLAEAELTLADIDHVAYSFDPALLGAAQNVTLPIEPSAHARDDGRGPWDELFLAYVRNAPRQLAGGAPHHLARRFRGVRHDGPFRWHFVEHHAAHEASAYLAAPFDDCAVLTLDGQGERATTTLGLYENGAFRRLREIEVPHSLGLLYEEITEHLGFLRSSDEYKVMALASYGEPRFREAFRDLIRVGEDGALHTERGFCERLFGPRRERGGPIGQHHYDLARSLQVALEDAVLDLARWLHDATGADSLAMAGGVALNCVMNARLRDRGPFRDIWVQPAAGDAGTALGAALKIDHELGARGERRWSMDHVYLGPAYADAEIEGFLRWSKLPYRRLDDVPREAAALLAADKIIGWFQGRMEFGPRALGARSILASPIDPAMQARLNEIKDREDFRPVAPVVLEEKCGEWFEGCVRSPFMLFVYDVKPERAARVPAIRHVDGTARVQTVNAAQNPRYHALLVEFERLTGVPVLVNTSFNTRGQPIVCTPRQAVECFWTSPLDALVIGSFLLEKGGS